jgi:release factor glutamine methyltransferase
MTYRTLLEQAQKHRDKSYAEYLLQGITNKKVFELYLDKSVVSQKIIRQFNGLLEQGKSNVPIQYLLQKTYFLSYELYVDERVMIPRFETEELVIKTAGKLNAQDVMPKAILDIGTGSGAIAIAMAHYFPESKIIATDISTDVLEVAEINVRKYYLIDRIGLFHADLFPSIENIQGMINLIISNPPYIPENEIENLSPTVKDYEPHLALNGGKQGFEMIERIITHAHNYLAPNGLLALEIDPRQTKLISNSKFLISNLFNVEFEKDNQGMIRYAFIKF